MRRSATADYGASASIVGSNRLDADIQRLKSQGLLSVSNDVSGAFFNDRRCRAQWMAIHSSIRWAFNFRVENLLLAAGWRLHGPIICLLVATPCNELWTEQAWINSYTKSNHRDLKYHLSIHTKHEYEKEGAAHHPDHQNSGHLFRYSCAAVNASLFAVTETSPAASRNSPAL